MIAWLVSLLALPPPGELSSTAPASSSRAAATWAWFICILATRAGSTLLHSQGMGPTLPTAAACEEQGELSCSPDYHKWQWVKGRVIPVPIPPSADDRQLRHTSAISSSSTVQPRQDTGPLTHFLQQLRVRDSSAELLNILWSPVAAQTGDILMVFSGSMSQGHQHRPLLLHGHRRRHGPKQNGLGLHRGLRWSGWPLPYPSLLSRLLLCTSLHNAQMILLLFLSHWLTAYLNIIATLAVGRPHCWMASGCPLSACAMWRGCGQGLCVSSTAHLSCVAVGGP